MARLAIYISIFFLAPSLCAGQGKMYFGGTSGTDTAITPNFIMLPKYATSGIDTAILGFDSRGKGIKITKGSITSGTLTWGDTLGSLATKYDLIGVTPDSSIYATRFWVGNNTVSSIFGRDGEVAAEGTDYEDYYVRHDISAPLGTDAAQRARTNIAAPGLATVNSFSSSNSFFADVHFEGQALFTVLAPKSEIAAVANQDLVRKQEFDAGIANGNTAYSWGNHATFGYVTASSTATFTNKSGNVSQWTNDAGYVTASSTSTFTNKSGNISQWTNNVGYGTFTLPALTAGSVLVSNGTTIAQDNGSFFWSIANRRLGIGTNNPGVKLHLQDSVTLTAILNSTGSGMNGRSAFSMIRSYPNSIGWQFLKDENDDFVIRRLNAAVVTPVVTYKFTDGNIYYSGKVIVNNGTTDNGLGQLQVTGNGWFSNALITGSPSGSTARPFKVGDASSVTPTSPNRTIAIEINGTTYYLHAKTTNN